LRELRELPKIAVGSAIPATRVTGSGKLRELRKPSAKEKGLRGETH
jgi:hypothetical protein